MSYYVKMSKNTIGFPENYGLDRLGESREQAMLTIRHARTKVTDIINQLMDNSTDPDIRYTIDTGKSHVVVTQHEGNMETFVFVAKIAQTEPHTKWRVSVNFEGAWKRHIIGEYDDLKQAKNAAYSVMVDLMLLLYQKQPPTSCDPDGTLHILGDKKADVHIKVLPPDTIEEVD